MHLADLVYDLPEHLIAKFPPEERDGARLLVLDRDSGHVTHAAIRELARRVRPSLWVVNDTRVMPARLHALKATGGKVEVLLTERLSNEPGRQRWLALIRGSAKLAKGAQLEVPNSDLSILLCERVEAQWEVELASDRNVDKELDRVGQLPLPPYLGRAPVAQDSERYQTVFARRAGAVAAPTAGLHLSERLIAEMREQGHRFTQITLHVGPGTFSPVRTERLEDHPMHAEWFEVSSEAADAIDEAKSAGVPVVAVGTTVVRTLESVVTEEGKVSAGEGRTNLFIRPPFSFRVIDALLTNFHLPGSTLLALVMAFGGVENVRAAYQHAVREAYRFYSYGDAMLLCSSEHLLP